MAAASCPRPLLRTLVTAIGLIFVVSGTQAADAPKFRTDADGPVVAGEKRDPKAKDPKPEWYLPVDGEFPPEGSAHAVSGELMFVDHLERRFQIRVDRNDSQERGVWDLPLDATMLPYGSIYYHGAPAALQDIPLGTHLRGLFYLKDPRLKESDDKKSLATAFGRKTPEYDFRRCFRIEDDFSFYAHRNQMWKIEGVDLEAKKLTAVLIENGKPAGDGKPKSFDLLSSTRVMQGRGFAELESLHAGQLVQLNLTWVTLYGPGRVTDVWVDDMSQALATGHQLERHRNHIRERGLAGYVTSVDDEPQIVTMTFFGGVDEKLFDEIMLTNSDKIGWPLSKEPDNQSAPKGTIAVARESLMTYDPVNDRKGGNILDMKKISVEPGSSGVQVRVKVDMMLEGYRPRRVIRFYPATWKVMALPREEQFQGRE